MVFNTCFVLRRSSILHLAFRSAILSLLELSCVIFHLKPSLRNVVLWCLSMIQVFSYPLGKRSFHLFVDLKQVIVPLVAGCHLIMLRCFHKPTTSLFFSLLVFQQLRSILLFKEALSNSIVIEVVVLFSVLLIPLFH